MPPLDKSVRDLRAVARCITLSRELGDALCEETLLAFLTSDPSLDIGTDYLPEFVAIMRRIYGSGMFVNGENTPKDPALRILAHLPIARREIAALHLGAGRSPEQIAAILRVDTCDVEREIAFFSNHILSSFARTPAAA